MICISQENHKSCYTPSFSRYSSRVDSSDINLEFQHFNVDPFLWIGITSANLNSKEKTLVEKERLNISVICNEISFFNSFSIFVGGLLGPTYFL